jgi:hypothetical protein
MLSLWNLFFFSVLDYSLLFSIDAENQNFLRIYVRKIICGGFIVLCLLGIKCYLWFALSCGLA